MRLHCPYVRLALRRRRFPSGPEDLENNNMRAEIVTLSEEIENAISLLRRRL